MTDNWTDIRPEDAGMDPAWLMRFLDEIEAHRLTLHGYMFCRDGKRALEAYWAPFTGEETHRLYSSTKSFVSVAIGLAADRGLLSLDDPIVRFFPEYRSAAHPYVAETTVRDLLRMTTPYSRPTYDDPALTGPEWLASYFRAKPDHPPGTLFRYDSCGSYVLGAIVKRAAGKPFFDFLRETLFDELGFSKDARCLEGPDGELWAGSAVLARLRDFARLAQFLMDGGRIHGRQLLSEAYVKAATTRQIDNNTEGLNSPWRCGYGYQIWILPDDAFAMVGMGDQLAICVPGKRFLFACVGDTQGVANGHEQIYDILWREVIRRLSDTPLPHGGSWDKLRKRAERLILAPVAGRTRTETAARVDGRRYILDDNPMGIRELTITADADEGTLHYVNLRGEKTLRFGFGRCLPGQFPEKHFNGDRLGVPAGRTFRCFSSGAWVQENTLLIRVHIADSYVGNLTIALCFTGERVALSMHKNAQFFLKEYQGTTGGRAAHPSDDCA